MIKKIIYACACGFLLLLVTNTSDAAHGKVVINQFDKAMSAGNLYHIDNVDLALADDASIVTMLTASAPILVKVEGTISGHATPVGQLTIGEDATGSSCTTYTPLNDNRPSSNTADTVAATGTGTVGEGTTICNKVVSNTVEPIVRWLLADTVYAIFLENESGGAAMAQLSVTVKE